MNTHVFVQTEGVGFQVLKVRAVDADATPANSIVTYSLLVSFDSVNVLNPGLKEPRRLHAVNEVLFV